MRTYKITSEAPDGSGVYSEQTNDGNRASQMARTELVRGWVNVKLYQLIDGQYALLSWDNVK